MLSSSTNSVTQFVLKGGVLSWWRIQLLTSFGHFLWIRSNNWVKKHHHLDLPHRFLLLNFLIFSLPFSQPDLTFTFEFWIVVVNLWFVNSGHSLTIPAIRILKYLQVLLCQPETKSHLSLREQMRNPHRTHVSFWLHASVFGSLTFLTCSRGSPMF